MDITFNPWIDNDIWYLVHQMHMKEVMTEMTTNYNKIKLYYYGYNSCDGIDIDKNSTRYFTRNLMFHRLRKYPTKDTTCSINFLKRNTMIFELKDILWDRRLKKFNEELKMCINNI